MRVPLMMSAHAILVNPSPALVSSSTCFYKGSVEGILAALEAQGSGWVKRLLEASVSISVVLLLYFLHVFLLADG